MVFETSAEMNNKYDIQNFAKLLESFQIEKEEELVSDFLVTGDKAYLPKIKEPKFEFADYKPASAAQDYRNLTADHLRKPAQDFSQLLEDNTLTQPELEELTTHLLSKLLTEPVHGQLYFDLVVKVHREGYSQTLFKLLLQQKRELKTDVFA